jgi:hypothetical protein
MAATCSKDHTGRSAADCTVSQPKALTLAAREAEALFANLGV